MKYSKTFLKKLKEEGYQDAINFLSIENIHLRYKVVKEWGRAAYEIGWREAKKEMNNLHKKT